MKRILMIIVAIAIPSLMVAQNSAVDDNVLIYITGNFNINDLEGLAESFDKDIDLDL